MAEGLGNCPPATVRAAETMNKELRLVYVCWSNREGAGVPELAGNELEAAAGVRPGARGCCRARQELRAAALAFWEAAERGGRCRRGLRWLWPRRGGTTAARLLGSGG